MEDNRVDEPLEDNRVDDDREEDLVSDTFSAITNGYLDTR